MKTYIVRTIALVLSVSLIAAIAGCRQTPSEDSEYSIIYVYESGDSTTNDNTVSNGNSGNADKDNSNNKNPSSDRVTTAGRPKKEVEEEAKNRAKNLKGRTITYVAYWEPISRESEEGKIITKVEELLNCKFVHKALYDYKPLYSSILAGKPIADIYTTKYDAALGEGANGLLTPLDTLSNFDLKNGGWNKAAVKEYNLDGHVYAITKSQQLRNIVMYNVDLLKNNNLPDLYELQKNGKLTWDTLYDIMTKAAKLGTEKNPVYGIVPKDYAYWDGAQLMLNGNGVFALSRVGETKEFKYGLNSEPAIYALNTLKKWFDEDLFYDSTKFGWDTGRTAFAQGRGLMAVVDQWQILQVLDQCNFECGMILFPHGPNYNKDVATFMIDGDAIPKGVKNPNDVALFWDLYQELKYAGVTDQFVNIYDLAPHESVKATIQRFVKMMNTNEYAHDWANSWGISFVDLYEQIIKGEISAAAAVKSSEQYAKGKIEDYYNVF